MWIDISEVTPKWFLDNKKEKKRKGFIPAITAKTGAEPHQPICMHMHLNKGAMESPSSRASKQAVQCGIAARVFSVSPCHKREASPCLPPRGSCANLPRSATRRGPGGATPSEGGYQSTCMDTTSTSTSWSSAPWRLCVALWGHADRCLPRASSHITSAPHCTSCKDAWLIVQCSAVQVCSSNTALRSYPMHAWPSMS